MRLKGYLDFCEAVRKERGYVCDACGRRAEECGDRKLHVHHLWPVAKSGIDSPLVMSRANVFLLCGWCHKLQHPGQRRWPWGKDAGAADGAASRARGRALR